MLILGFTIQGTFKPSTYITYISNTIMGGDFVLPKQLEFPPKCTYRQILCPKVYISTKIIHTYTCKHNHTYECKHHSTHTINSRMIHTHSNVEWAHVFSCQQKHCTYTFACACACALTYIHDSMRTFACAHALKYIHNAHIQNHTRDYNIQTHVNICTQS